MVAIPHEDLQMRFGGESISAIRITNELFSVVSVALEKIKKCQSVTNTHLRIWSPANLWLHYISISRPKSDRMNSSLVLQERNRSESKGIFTLRLYAVHKLT